MLIEVDKKYFIMIMATMLVLAGTFLVVSYNSVPANPAIMGHSLEEIELTGVCMSDGTNCATSGPSTYEGCTIAKYGGNLGGYSGADAKCAAEFPGSRMCNSQDLPQVVESIEEGCYGKISTFEASCSISVRNHMTDSDDVSVYNCDCNQWTTTNGAFSVVSKNRGYVSVAIESNCYPSYSLHCCQD